jgi:hypothetical protein
MVRKNLKLSKISQNLMDTNYIASFLGISLNALYLRMHFDNFPKALKINGKLYFDLNEVLSYFTKNDEKEAFCYLVRDEIRTLLDAGKISRLEVGEAIGASNPLVAGGALYTRAIGYERAQKLHEYFKQKRMPLEIDEQKSFVEQKKERTTYSFEVWNALVELVDSGKIDFAFIAKALSSDNDANLGKSICKHSPSFKSAKILKLRLLQRALL